MESDEKIKTKIKNFTPLLDSLVAEHGLLTAAVWGRIWRYAQQENGVCEAAQTKIGKELRLTRETVNRHISKLVDEGYLFDLTPSLKNSPHVYKITEKAQIIITVEGVINDHTTVINNHSGCDYKSQPGVIKSHAKKQLKKQLKKQEEFVFPPHFQTERFSKTWEEFMENRKQLQKPMTELAKQRMINRLSKFNESVAIAMIEQSIEKGWLDVYPLKEYRTNERPQNIPEGV